MYEYVYDEIWYVYEILAHCWYYMLVSPTYGYMLVYIVKVWWYVLLNAMIREKDVSHDSSWVTWMSMVMGLCLVIALLDLIGVSVLFWLCCNELLSKIVAIMIGDRVSLTICAKSYNMHVNLTRLSIVGSCGVHAFHLMHVPINWYGLVKCA